MAAAKSPLCAIPHDLRLQGAWTLLMDPSFTGPTGIAEGSRGAHAGSLAISLCAGGSWPH